VGNPGELHRLWLAEENLPPSLTMLIIFPADPINPKAIDDAFANEAHAARHYGFEIATVSMELMFGGDVYFHGTLQPGPVLYRGWIMKPPHYRMMAEALAAQGCHLVMQPEHYDTTYHLPIWYERNFKRGPYTVWNQPFGETFTPDEVHGISSNLGEIFGPSPVVLKDYLKSQKHYWHEACFIPDATDVENVEKVITTFLKLTHELVGGLVFREFINFKRIGTHPKSKLPLINEGRVFLWQGEDFFLAPYWVAGQYDNMDQPSREVILDLVKGLRDIPFFTADLAQKETGQWELVEIGDGGSSGIPETVNSEDFYRALAVRCILPK
jgi:hypothetical protein